MQHVLIDSYCINIYASNVCVNTTKKGPYCYLPTNNNNNCITNEISICYCFCLHKKTGANTAQSIGDPHIVGFLEQSMMIKTSNDGYFSICVDFVMNQHFVTKIIDWYGKGPDAGYDGQWIDESHIKFTIKTLQKNNGKILKKKKYYLLYTILIKTNS